MVSRRDFLKLGAATAAGAPALAGKKARAHETDLNMGGEDYSSLSGTEREPIPTACAMCASRCAAIGYVEEGYVVKLGELIGKLVHLKIPEPHTSAP